jgi:hypothetical protein
MEAAEAEQAAIAAAVQALTARARGVRGAFGIKAGKGASGSKEGGSKDGSGKEGEGGEGAALSGELTQEEERELLSKKLKNQWEAIAHKTMTKVGGVGEGGWVGGWRW